MAVAVTPEVCVNVTSLLAATVLKPVPVMLMATSADAPSGATEASVPARNDRSASDGAIAMSSASSARRAAARGSAPRRVGARGSSRRGDFRRRYQSFLFVVEGSCADFPTPGRMAFASRRRLRLD